MPQATYNLQNSPHLRPAFVLDRVVKRLARDIGEGAWVERGIPKVTMPQCFEILFNLIFREKFHLQITWKCVKTC